MTKRFFILSLTMILALSAWGDVTTPLITETTITFEGTTAGTYQGTDASSGAETTFTNYSLAVYGTNSGRVITSVAGSASGTIAGVNYSVSKYLTMNSSAAWTDTEFTKRTAGGNNLANTTFAPCIAFNTGVAGTVYIAVERRGSNNGSVKFAYQTKGTSDPSKYKLSAADDVNIDDNTGKRVLSYNVPEATTVLIRGNMKIYAIRFVPSTHSVTAVTSTGEDTYGTVSAASSTVAEGVTTTITAVPATGYQVSNWVVSGTGASISPSGDSNSNTTTLTMGTADATVTCTFAPISYNITVNQPASGGSFTVKVGDADAVSTSTTANYNQTITLANTPNDGFVLSSYSVTKTASSESITVTNGQFTMPNEAVTITATFVEDTPAADPVPVIIVAGQSNTDGRAMNDSLPQYIRTQENNQYPHVYWSYGNGTNDKVTGTFDKYWPACDASPNTRWAYDAVVYYHLQQTLNGSDLYVIKESKGGTAINTSCSSTGNMWWSADETWLSSATSADADGQSLLLALKDNIDKSLTTLANANKTADIKFLMWHQGEADRGKGTEYQTQLQQVINYIRNYLVTRTGNAAYANLPVILGGIKSTTAQYSEAVETAKQAIATADANIYYVSSEDFPVNAYRQDNLHFNFKGAELFGKRVYDLIAEHQLLGDYTYAAKSTTNYPPVISFNSETGKVTIENDADSDATGGTIYYTTNGSTPTSSSTAYSEPFSLTLTSTVKAISIKDDLTSFVSEKNIAVPSPAVTYDFAAGYTASETFTLPTSGTDNKTTVYYYGIAENTPADASYGFYHITSNTEKMPVNGRISWKAGTASLVEGGMKCTSTNRYFAIHDLCEGDKIRIVFTGGTIQFAKHSSKGNAITDLATSDELTSSQEYTISSIDATNNYVVFYPTNNTIISQIYINVEDTPSETIVIHTIGDSTMSHYDQSIDAQKGMDGWGDYLQDCMIDGVTVNNWADRGETARSYYNGIWSTTSTDRPEFAEPIANKVNSGDYVIIQFGHNDSKAYSTVQYETWLGTLVDAVKTKGATPILAGSICRARFSNGQITRLGRIDTYEDSGRILEDGASIDDYTFDYPYHAQQVAIAKGIQFIDVTTGVKNMFETYGEAKTKALFPSGEKTHTNKLGAQLIAKVAAKLLLGTDLADYVDQTTLELPAADDIEIVIDNFGEEAVVTKKTIWTFNTDMEENAYSDGSVIANTLTERNGLYVRGGADGHAITASAYTGDNLSFTDGTEINVTFGASTAANDISEAIGTETAGRAQANARDRCFAFNIGTPGTIYALVKSTSNDNTKKIKLVFTGKTKETVVADGSIHEIKFSAETTGIVYLCGEKAFCLYALMFVPDMEAGTEEDWNYQMLKTRENGYWTYTNMSGGNQSVPEGLTAYAVSEINSAGKAVLADYGNVIPAGAAVLVKGEPNTEYAMLPTESAGTYSGTNLLKPNTELRYLPATESDKTNYYFDGTQFVKATGGETIHEKQAYLNVGSTAATIALNIPETITLPTFTITGNSVAITNGASTEAGTIKSYYQIGTSDTAPAIGVGTWTEYTEAITMTATGYVYAYSKNTATNVTSAVAVSEQVVLSAAVIYDFMAAYAADNTITPGFPEEGTTVYYNRDTDATGTNRSGTFYPITVNTELLPVNSTISCYNKDQAITEKGLSSASGRPFAIHNLKVGDVIRIEFDGAMYYAKSTYSGGKGNALEGLSTGDVIKNLRTYTVSSIDADNNYVVFNTSATTTISQISINEELTMKYVPKPIVSTTYTENEDSYTYTISYQDGATLHYTLPGGEEQTKIGGESLNVNVTKIGDLTAYATLNTMTSETTSQRVYAPTPAIASGEVYDFALVKEAMLKDYTLGTHGYGDAITIGGVAMKKPDAVVAKTFDRFAFTSEYMDGENPKDGKEWVLLSAGRLRAKASTHDDKMAILNVKKGQYLTLTYSGAAVKYLAGGTATMAESTDTLFSGKSYEILTDGNLLLIVTANSEKNCDITGISLASTETVTAPTIEARTEINKVTLRLGTSSFGKTVTAYYTIDGSTPTTSSTAVTKDGAVTVDESCTMKAYCVSETGVASGVTEYKVSLPAASKSASVVYDWLNLIQHSDTVKFATDGLTVYDKEYDSTNGWVTKRRTDFLAATNLYSKVSVRNGYKGLIYDTSKKTIRLTKPLAIHNLAVDDEIVIIYTGDGSLYSGAADEGDVFTINGKTGAAGTAIPSGAVLKVTKQKYENNYVVVTPLAATSGKVFISAIYINHAAPNVANTPKCELTNVNLDKMESTYRFTFDEGAMLFYMNTADNETLAGSNTGTFDITVTESAKLKAWEVNGTLTSDTLSVTVYAPTPAPSTTGNFDFTEASEDLPADIEVTLDASKSVTVGGETLYKPSALTAATFGDKFAFTETGSSNKIRIRTNHQLVFAKGTDMSMGLLNLKKGDIISFDYTGTITFANPSQVSVESSVVAARGMTRAVSSDLTSGTAYIVQADGDVLLKLDLSESSANISKMYIAAAPTTSAAKALDFATAAEEYEDVETGNSTSVWFNGKDKAQTFKRLINDSDELPIDGKVSTESGSGEITIDGIKASNRHIAIHNLAVGDEILVRFYGGALTYDGHETKGNRVKVNGKTLAAQDTLTSGDVIVVEKVDYLNNYVVLKLDSKCSISGIFINREEIEKVWAPTIVESGKNTVLITAGRSSMDYQVTTYYTTDGTDPSDRNGIGGPYESYDVELLDGSLVPVKAISYSSSGKVSRIATFNIFADTRTEIVGVPVETSKPQVIYDLQGRKVETPLEGRIYIIEGKKVLYRRK